MADTERTQTERTAKPSGATGPSSKGAVPAGANEMDGDPSGIIQPAAQVPPGEDQPHLLGGDVGTPQTSQTGNPNWKDEPETASPKAAPRK